MSWFESLASELGHLILAFLPREDLGRFSQCSRFCYSLAAPVRYGLHPVILSSAGVGMFESNGLGERYKDLVRSVRFEDPANWILKLDDLSKNGKLWEIADDIVQVVDSLRWQTTAITIFPNITKLTISYKIPTELEANAFVAVLSRICNHPFYQNLKELDISIYKNTILGQAYGRTSYETLYKAFVADTREFLGPKILQPLATDCLRQDYKLPTLPSLRRAKISVNGISFPYSADGVWLVECSSYYYYPLMLAPKLEELRVESTNDSWKHCELYSDGLVVQPFQWTSFMGLTSLAIVGTVRPSTRRLLRIVERYPNLKRLELGLLKNETIRQRYDRQAPYECLGQLKKLEEVILPWPSVLREVAQSFYMSDKENIRPEVMKGWVAKWVKGGMSGLNTATFEGARHPGRGFAWEDITLTIENIDGKLELKGNIDDFEDSIMYNYAVA